MGAGDSITARIGDVGPFDLGRPRQITPVVRAFCAELTGLSDPELHVVPVRPAHTSQSADCFVNVADHVQQAGGRIRYGWLITEIPRTMLEAAFHAVWQSPDGELMDLTPHQFGASTILFAADPTRTYDGRMVNNVRRPLTPSRAFDDYDRARNDWFALMNRGERATQHGRVSLTKEEERELRDIQAREQAATMKLMVSAMMPGRRPASSPAVDLPRVGRNDPCPCGSGKKYKKCHGL
jgi:hypothetical protein